MVRYVSLNDVLAVSDYIVSQEWARHLQIAEIRELGGGVSNRVYRVRFQDGFEVILKQPLEKLKVEAEWFASADRIEAEAKGLEVGGKLVSDDFCPRIINYDSSNRILVTEAAPAEALDWKKLLMSNKLDPSVAVVVGQSLGKLQSASRNNENLRNEFLPYFKHFEELRLEPYFAPILTMKPNYKRVIEDALRICRSEFVCLVHGDYSPKNFLVWNSGIWLVDWEVVHYGDPNFDPAFMLCHLTLKSFYLTRRNVKYEYLLELIRTFWKSFANSVEVKPDWHEALIVLLGLLLARLFGKSKAEYLDDEDKSRVERFVGEIVANPYIANTLFDYCAVLEESLKNLWR